MSVMVEVMVRNDLDGCSGGEGEEIGTKGGKGEEGKKKMKKKNKNKKKANESRRRCSSKVELACDRPCVPWRRATRFE
jgi:hypothetical protein